MAGGCFPLRLGWSALQEAWSGGLRRTEGRSVQGAFTTGAVFSLANPVALAFWGGIGGAVTATGAPGSSVAGTFAGFVLGALLWCLALPLAVGCGRRVVHPAVFRVLDALAGLALGSFGIRLLWDTLHAALGHVLATV